MGCILGFGDDCGVQGGVGEPRGPLWPAILNQFAGWDRTIGRPQDPRVIAAIVIKGFMTLLGVVFLCFVIYAGVTWMTAAGDEEKIRKAKSTLVTGVIGMLIIFAAFSIAQLVVVAFGCATGNYGVWCLFFNNLSY